VFRAELAGAARPRRTRAPARVSWFLAAGYQLLPGTAASLAAPGRSDGGMVITAATCARVPTGRGTIGSQIEALRAHVAAGAAS
jgi:hypothetical protein